MKASAERVKPASPWMNRGYKISKLFLFTSVVVLITVVAMAERDLGISNAEWKIMEVVWRDEPTTAQEIVIALSHETQWKPQTIKTLISRLVKKKALTFKTIGNRYLYRSGINKEDAVQIEARSFINRIGRASFGPLLTQFAEASEPLSEEEIDELKRILRERGGSK
jgi:BlaI family penicillinase repressor